MNSTGSKHKQLTTSQDLEDYKGKSTGLHLCMVCCFPPSKGPLSEYAFHLANHFSKNSKISKLTILADKINDDQIHVSEKIEVVRCWNLNDILAPLNIIKRIYHIKPDVIYFNLLLRYFSYNRIINLFGSSTPAIVKLLGIPVVVTHHNLVESIDLEAVGYKNSWINKAGIGLAIRLALKANVITTTNEHQADTIKRKYNVKNVLYIPHGVFSEPMSNIDFNSKKLLFFGKVSPYKNLNLTIEAFKEVYDKDREAELLIAGSSSPLTPGSMESTLEKNNEIPNITIRGYIPEDEIQSVFTSCVAVVLPYSTTVWSSGVFNLACSYGRPVIASDLPDFRELRNEGAGIILFHKGDSRSLANVMELILHDKELQKKVGEANLKWARKYGVDRIANRLVDIFDGMNRKDDIQKITAHIMTDSLRS
jgi:glycosyltransferase involved in cell wall biosynthesis